MKDRQPPIRERADQLRPALGAVFLAGYALHTFAPGSFRTAAFLISGAVLYLLSVPWSSAFHRGLAAASFGLLGVTVATGRFDTGRFLEGMPTYFGVVAVLLVLSVAGYPLRAARYEAQIRALVAALSRRGANVRTTAGVLGHGLGSVLDVGAFVLVDVISARAAPRERLEALKWAGRAFSFAPLWTNLNVFTATTIVLTGVTYPGLLSVTLPFAMIGLAATLLAAQRGKADAAESDGVKPLDRRALAVLFYPVGLVAAVAAVNFVLPGVSLTAAISLTVAAVVLLSAGVAALVLRRSSPLERLARETRAALTASHAEFALFGSAGVLVLSLQMLGALAPLGALLAAFPVHFVAPALAAVMGVGFMLGIHVIPLVLMVDAAFPLDSGPAPALWAAAILLGSQAAILLTPFSSAVTMLARLSGLHPLEIGPRRNWRFGLAVATAALLYLGLLTPLLL
ncbi:hypothetical protein Rxycam_01031 [Rubrobacter xylanophilus DSM 9941]|uniref:hypothetical protein n=1 Tax=Rubrobacter xylanophilus TaxID=49319 RepID=UPI001C63D72C|nr:hypothetical protein [Rubrobacter xylanophilus]QYJ15216.1 hypothetical protein Rxycam_01031 [Rubrobacter xylanophilus DSM 9941]